MKEWSTLITRFNFLSCVGPLADGTKMLDTLDHPKVLRHIGLMNSASAIISSHLTVCSKTACNELGLRTL